MQQQEFELSMAKFFEKAGVQIVKKGEGYSDDTNLPAYILLDKKRKSYYAAESDVFDNAIEDENISKFMADASLSENAAHAVYTLSKAANSLDDSFSLNDGTDLSALTLKYSLVISEENSNFVKEYLENNAYKFQSVPLKGKFLVIFIDESMKKKLSSIYSFYNQTDGQEDDNMLSDEDIAPVFEPKDDTIVDNIDLNTKTNDFDAETPLVSPKNDDESKEDIDEEEMLDSIDLNDLIKPKEAADMPKDETEADLLYGKFLNEQTEKIEVSNTGPVEKSLDEIPEGLIDEEDIKEMTSNDDTNKSAKTQEKMDKKAAKQQAKEEKKQARLAKKREQEAQKYTYENRNKSWLDIPGRIFANIIGILFFLPMYVLNKLLGRFLPPFVLYWLAAIVAVFGVYQMVFSLIPQPFSSTFQEAANTAMQHIQSFDTEIEKMYSTDNMTVTDNKTAANESVEYDIAQTSLTMMKSSAVMFYAFLKSIDVVMNKGILLQYLLGFAASMLVIPAFRFIGKTLTIFLFISYFLLPLIAYSQSRLIDYAFTLNEVNLTAAAVTFLVYVYPVILFFVVLYISSALVPDKETRREVLP